MPLPYTGRPLSAPVSGQVVDAAVSPFAANAKDWPTRGLSTATCGGHMSHPTGGTARTAEYGRQSVHSQMRGPETLRR